MVADVGTGRLLRVDPKTGVRTALSGGYGFLDGIAIGQGRIFVTDASGISAIDPHTGNPTPVGPGGGAAFGAAVDASGRVLINDAPNGPPTRIVRVDILAHTSVIVSDLTNLAQGDTLSCCEAYFTDLARERSGAIVESVTWFIPFGSLADTGDILRVDPTTGNRSLLSDFTDPAQGPTDLVPWNGIAIETSGQILVDVRRSASIAPANRDWLLRIDPASGNRTVLSDFGSAAQGPTGGFLSGVAVEPCGQIIVGAGHPANEANTGVTRLFRVNPQTGQRTLLSDASDPKQGPPFGAPTPFGGRYLEIAVVPENAGCPSKPVKNSFASPFGPVK